MGLTELTSVKAPPFNNFSLPERILDRTDSLANTAKEKGSSILKGLDLSLEWVAKMSRLNPKTQDAVGLAEKGFKEAGALETLTSIVAVVPQVSKSTKAFKEKVTAWKKGEIETPKLQDIAKKTFFGFLFPAIKKVDDIFWALANFDLFKNPSVDAFHGVGYGVGSLVAAKNLYDAGKEFRDMQANVEEEPITPEKWKLSIAKIGKLVSSVGAAITGLALMIISSTKLSFVYLGFSTTSLGCTLSEHMIDRATDPAVKEQKLLEEKLKREKTFQMIV